MEVRALLLRVRIILALFAIGLLLSGLTAIPLRWELDTLISLLQSPTWSFLAYPPLMSWLSLVQQGIHQGYGAYPFLAYGTDWLAFGHMVIALAFLGPLRDPVRNIWVIDLGIIACILTWPLAFIMGPIRGIPLGWILLDCSFGFVGLFFLWPARRMAMRMERLLQVQYINQQCLQRDPQAK